MIISLSDYLIFPKSQHTSFFSSLWLQHQPHCNHSHNQQIDVNIILNMMHMTKVMMIGPVVRSLTSSQWWWWWWRWLLLITHLHSQWQWQRERDSDPRRRIVADYSRSPRAAIIVVMMVMLMMIKIVMMMRMVLMFLVMANIRAKYGSYNNLFTFTMRRVYPFSITELEKLSALPPFSKETIVSEWIIWIFLSLLI